MRTTKMKIFLVFLCSLKLASGFTFFSPAENKTEEEEIERCEAGEGVRALNWDPTCKRYFACVDGLWNVRSCQPGTVIDLVTGKCTHPDNTVEWIRPECRESALQSGKRAEEAIRRQQQEEETTTVNPHLPVQDKESLGTSPDASNTLYNGRNPYLCTHHDPHTPIAHRDCNKYRQCVNGFWHTRECNPGTVFDVSTLKCGHRHLAWGCGLKAENAYKKQVADWIALAEEAAKEQEAAGPTTTTPVPVFEHFGPGKKAEFEPATIGIGSANLPEDDSAELMALQLEVAEMAQEMTDKMSEMDAEMEDIDEEMSEIEEEMEDEPRAGSPCFGENQLHAVKGNCLTYLECAPDAQHYSFLLRFCPGNTFYNSEEKACDYQDQVAQVRSDCGFLQGKREGFNEQLEESDDLTSLPAADLLAKILAEHDQ